MAFDDVRFPVNISFGSSGGPTYLTDVVILENAAENRAAIWSIALYRYDVAYGIKTLADLQAVHIFFHGRVAQLRSFRFKDFLDFEATLSPLIVTGGKTIQLTKNYTSGLQMYDRIIRKPTEDFVALTMRRAGAPFVGFTLDANTGIVTITTPDATAAIDDSLTAVINNITQATQAVVTTVGVHPFVTGDIVDIAGVVGMVEVNGLQPTITDLGPNDFRLDGVDSQAFTAYVSDGTAILPGMTQSNPVRIHAPAHGFSSANVLRIVTTSMVEMNGREEAITVLDVDRFTMPIDSTLFSVFTDAGSPEAELYIQDGGDAMDWTGQFDVPVRFGIDEIPVRHDGFEYGSIGTIPLVEVRED